MEEKVANQYCEDVRNCSYNREDGDRYQFEKRETLCFATYIGVSCFTEFWQNNHGDSKEKDRADSLYQQENEHSQDCRRVLMPNHDFKCLQLGF